MHFLNVIDTPTDTFYGNDASIEIGTSIFNTPGFFVGVVVGIISCLLVKKIYTLVTKYIQELKKQNKDKKDK